MTRGGRTKDRTESGRRCIVTSDSGSKAGLIRVVVGPEDKIVPDLAEKLPGRGIWVSADRSALETAAQKNHFARSAKGPVKVDPNLINQVEDLLVRRITDTLSLARKAGAAVAGYEKVRTWLDKGEAAVLIQAHDGSKGMRSKLHAPDGPESLVEALTAQEMGVAFGRDTVVHAALKAGGLAGLCVSEAGRLKGVRRMPDETKHKAVRR